MGEGGRFPSKGGVHLDVFGGGDEPFGSSDDVGDFHELVVDDVGEVVGGKSVPLPDDEVVFGFGFLVTSVHDVLYHHWLFGALEPDGKWFSVVGPLLRLLL